MQKPLPTAAIIGGGPAGLMAAQTLARRGVAVRVYDQMPSLARKFLMAGRGGLNLTHSEPLAQFLMRYEDAAPSLQAAIEAFPPQALRDWSAALGEPTFVGSSGRVFPKSFKASPLLRAWLRELDRLGAAVSLRHRWEGWTEDGSLSFATPAGGVADRADVTVLALGGASWPKLGSGGEWQDILRRAGIGMSPWQPVNCGFEVRWSEIFRQRFAGQPLKRIALRFGASRVLGEVTITESGLEGGAIYSLSRPLRDAIGTAGPADLRISLRPDLTAADVQQRLARDRGKQSMPNHLRRVLKLPPAAIGLLHEAALAGGASLAAMDSTALAMLVNDVPVRLVAPMPIARAISSSGGVRLAEVDASFMLRKMPGVFVAGEMLDWDAPTGGYLLQASMATGVAAGAGACAWLSRGEAPHPGSGR